MLAPHRGRAWRSVSVLMTSIRDPDGEANDERQARRTELLESRVSLATAASHRHVMNGVVFLLDARPVHRRDNFDLSKAARRLNGFEQIFAVRRLTGVSGDNLELVQF